MANQITTAFVQQYTTNVMLLAQQNASRLRRAVTVGSYTGKAAVPVEQIGLVELQPLITRAGDTPVIETPHARRWVSPQAYGGGDYLDEEDKVQALINPDSAYARAQAAAANRAIDRAIINAAIGTAKVGADGTTNEAFDTTNFQITIGGVLNLATLVTAREKIMAANVDPDDEFYVVMRQRHISQLLAAAAVNNYVTPIVTNQDFFPTAGPSPLMSATLPLIAGFRVIQTELLASTQVICFAKSRMHLGLWKDVESSIDRVPTKNNNWLVQTKVIFGATRLEQAGVVSIITT